MARDFDYEKFMDEKISEFQLSEHRDLRKNIDLLTFEDLKELKEINIIFNDINAQPRYFFQC
jgi:hypothetical protein